MRVPAAGLHGAPAAPAHLTIGGAALLAVITTFVAVGCAASARGGSQGPRSLSAAPFATSPSLGGDRSAPSVIKLAPESMSAPVRVQIPAIGVDSGLIGLGLQKDGTMQVPPTGFPAGWYTGAATPGEIGPAIIVGHVDWGGHPGVFFKLRDLRPDDKIVVGRADGSTAVFRVTRLETFAKTQFPTQAVYGPTDYASLRLITCGGTFDQRAQSYTDNIVAFAKLVSFAPHGG